jgi:hypothetical protein
LPARFPYRRATGGCANPGASKSQRSEKLIDDLADCLAQLQDDADIEQIDRILEKLDQQDPAAPNFDAEQALSDFHEKYADLFAADPPAAPAKRPSRRKPFSNL